MKNVFLQAHIFLFLLLFSISSKAQVTSSTISGKVQDIQKQDVIGATVLAFHLPSGTKYGMVTDADGGYTIADMNPGGPYRITISYIGYTTQDKENVFLSLGANTGFDFTLSDKPAIMTEVVIKAEKGGLKTGSGTKIGEEMIKTLPSANRSIQDMTRLTPQNSNNSFAGTNFRYNNVTIDGTINNDAIGFSASLGGQTNSSGMPGSSTRTNSISLDAIQDVQVYIAPFDIKIGNFLGGSVNAVTRSGTNTVSGSIYAYGRNASLVGPNNAGDKSSISSEYYDYQTGFRIGLPIIKDKLFFFSNIETTKHKEPVSYSAGSTDASGTPIGILTNAEAQQITDTLQKRYGFNPGTYGAYSIYSQSTKLFNRIDFKINDQNSLSLRNNTVISEATNLERDGASFRFGGMDFKQTNNQSSTVAELKSRFGNKASNSLILGYSAIHDFRDPTSSNTSFPQTEIGYKGGTIYFGNDREATVFNMKQNTFELTDNFTLYKGKHTLTFGTHNEFYDLTYGFVNALNGRVSYKSLADFNYDNGTASNVNRVRGTYASAEANNNRQTLIDNPYAQYSVKMLSAYAQDEIQVTKNLKLVPGIRVDYASVGTNPPVSATSAATIYDAKVGTTYTNTPINQITNNLFGNALISPRLGWNWDVNGNRSFIVRGGTGIFTGRIPFAWLGYAYYNDGVGFYSYDINNKAVLAGQNITVKGDPLTVNTSATSARDFAVNNGQAKLVQADLIDNNFKMPQVWRTNLGLDYTTAGYKFTVEILYTKVLNDLKFQQVNLRDSVVYYSYDTNKEMPIYQGGKINTGFSNAYMLSNTDQGYRYSITAQVSKSYDMGLSVMAAYTYGESKDITNGIRNSMESNFQMNQSLSPNNPQLAYSNFDVRNRFIAQIGYKAKWNEKHTTTFSLYASTQTGAPFTWGIVNGTLANTGQAAGLSFLPNNVSQFAAAGATPTAAQVQNFADYQAFVSQNPYLATRQGKFTERNGDNTPSNTTADLRIMHQFNFGAANKQNIQISLDIFNLTNLLNSSWGWAYFVPNTFNSTASTGLTIAGNSTPAQGDIYKSPYFKWTNPGATPYQVDQFSSRYQMQLGLRYSF
jgi:hypothetical protein